MTNIERAHITKELVKAAGALRSAYAVAAATDLDLCKTIREQQKRLGETVASLRGDHEVAPAVRREAWS